MKVSELTGAQLDYWVAMAEGVDILSFDSGVVCIREGCWSVAYEPSTEWVDGGPIIERARIHLFQPTRQEPICAATIDDDYDWEGGRSGSCESWWGHGETPLIAAMRCYVASKFGVEVAQEGKAS